MLWNSLTVGYTWEIMKESDLSLGERVTAVENSVKALQEAMGGVAFRDFTSVGIHVFPGGRMPERQTDGAIGFDAYARAVVDPASKPQGDNPLRRTMADFMRTPGWEERIDESLVDKVVNDPEGCPDRYAIVLPPRERLMLGLGFASRMHYPLFYWVAPRSGHASRGITIANSPGTVDPDYTGEAGALMENNSGKDFTISHGLRCAQVLFQIAIIPELRPVIEHADIGVTNRGAGGFGSTGTHNR